MRLHRTRVRFRRLYLFVPILLMLVVPILMVWSNTLARSSVSNPNQEAAQPSPLCHKGDPLAGIYNPLRFRVLSSCEIASGVVSYISPQGDGGVRIGVNVDAKYSRLIGPSNISGQNRLLILQQDSGDNLRVFSTGERISFVGPLVYDVENQFNAICPVWSITPS